jgi:hypothetical protein
MQSSLRSAVLILAGCFAAPAASVLLPADSIAAQSAGEHQRATSQLFQAVQANDLAAVQASVGEGADVEARDRWGMTPTDIAIDRGHYRIAHFLVSVRNSRRGQDAGSAASASSATDDTALVPAVMRKPRSTATSTSPAKLDSPPPEDGGSVAAWPAGEPDPFDPTTPAPGSQLRSMQRGR